MSRENVEVVREAFEAFLGFTGKIATVSTLRRGRATRVQMFPDHAEALQAVGLSAEDAGRDLSGPQ